MKRVAILVVVIICIAVFTANAQSEITPSMYMIGRGLTVLDSQQLSNYGLDNTNLLDLDFSFCMYMYHDKAFGNEIVWYDDGELYLAVDLIGSLLGASNDEYALSSVFEDFCNAYEFDALGFGDKDNSYFNDDLSHFAVLAKFAGESQAHFIKTKEQFFNTLHTDVIGE